MPAGAGGYCATVTVHTADPPPEAEGCVPLPPSSSPPTTAEPSPAPVAPEAEPTSFSGQPLEDAEPWPPSDTVGGTGVATATPVRRMREPAALPGRADDAGLAVSALSPEQLLQLLFDPLSLLVVRSVPSPARRPWFGLDPSRVALSAVMLTLSLAERLWNRRYDDVDIDVD